MALGLKASRQSPLSRSVVAVVAAVLVAGLVAAVAHAARGRTSAVLLVGAWLGAPGRYSSVQAAVDAAKPGDWILVAPGDYRTPATAANGVLIRTANLHLRGMERNGVIVDGTQPGSTPPCSPTPEAQAFGPIGSDGRPAGRNGIEVLKASGVTVDNLTVCNFLGGSAGHNGNQLWFNGGDGSGRIGLGAYQASYVSATSTYFSEADSAMARYGIFASNASGPGLISDTAANNMGDSAYYIGACRDCRAVLDGAHGSHSALGYSGTNSGGHLIIQRSEFDDNRGGIVPSSLNNDDAPPPQDGACPAHGIGSTGTHSCTVIRDNSVHDNNNPNVPRAGVAALAPIGAGIELAGARNNTVVGNHVVNNGAWGILVHDFSDLERPPQVSHCQGGIEIAAAVCYFLASGNRVVDNVVAHNGFFANPGNADLGLIGLPLGPGNCFHGNVNPEGEPTSDPPLVQIVDGGCGPVSLPGLLVALQTVCASDLVGSVLPLGLGCPTAPITHYPATTTVTMAPLSAQPGLANPCDGVPVNPWCPAHPRGTYGVGGRARYSYRTTSE